MPRCLLFLLLIFPALLIAQPQRVEWALFDGNKGDDTYRRVIQLAQGMLALAGNQTGTNQPGVSGVVSLVDYSSGKLASKYELGVGIQLNSLLEHPDGALLLAGQSTHKGMPFPWLAKMDLRGKILWQKTLDNIGLTGFTDLVLDTDNKLVLSGLAKDGSCSLLKCDTLGNVLWQKKWGATELGSLRTFAIGGNGLICLAGNTVKGTGQTPGDVWVMLLDASGKMLWQKFFGDKLWEEVMDLAVLPDGSVLFCGETNSTGSGKQDMWLVRLNATGFKQWERTYGGREEDRATALLVLHNGNVLIAGSSLSLLDKKGATKFAARIAEVDPGGNLQWEYDGGGEENEGVEQLFQIHDGSFLLAGWTASFGKGGKDSWLVRFPGQPLNRLMAKGNLNLEHSKVWLNTSDGILRPGIQSYLSFELTNLESNRMDNVRIAVRPVDAQDALQVQQDIYTQPLFPGSARQVFVPIGSGSALESKDNQIEFQIFSGSDLVKSFTATVKSLNPKASALRFIQTLSSREGIDPYSPQVLTVEIQNDGDLPAEGVQVGFAVPKGLLPLSSEAVSIGKIEPKSTGKATFRFQRTVQYEGNEATILCEVREETGTSIRKEVATRLDVLQAGQRTDFILFTQPNEARVKQVDWSAPTFQLEATFGTTSKDLKPGDAVVKVNGMIPDQSKMDEEDLSVPTTQGNLYYYAYSNTIGLREGENKVVIEVVTPAGVVQSNEMRINYRPKQPNLHVLSIGIPHRDLKYTTQDAEQVAAAFANQAGPDKVFGRVYVDKRNTKENTRNLDIRAAMEDLRRRYSSEMIQGKITREDVLILFISSHGKTDDNNDFKILASDYDTYGDVSNIDYKRDILDILNSIDCKKFIFIDACHSGSAEGARLLNQARFALEEINAAYPGMNVMTSSQVDELSYEDDSWGNGAFTEAILEGFKGQPVIQPGGSLSPDSNGDKVIRFGELYEFMKRRVPALVMERKKSKQMPVKMSKGLGDDIPIFVIY